MVMSNENAVIVRHLEKHFGDFKAVNDISFEVKRGEVFGFLGPNGAGKSTTIRMLCGILLPTSGSAQVAGCDLKREAEKIKSRIGYMSQKFSLYEELTVEENIDFYGGIYGIPDRSKKERKEWVLEMAGLTGQRKLRVEHLAGGWKQRLALGCAIIHQPPILFLDEPTSGVDVTSRRRFWDLIYSMSSAGTTVFVTTHYMDEAEYCDRLALMYRGELIAEGSPEALKRQLINQPVLEIYCERPEDALLELSQHPRVEEAALFGSGLHVVLTDASAGDKGLLAEFLQHSGFAVKSMGRISPSLEDVFVSLIRQKDRLDPPEQEVRA